jgi:DNA-binding HxlR family transcriptional regulator
MGGTLAEARSYEDPCGVARALDRIGERWALLVVRELYFGPKRFGDLRAGLPGASPNVLSQRLRELERAGVVARRKLDPPAKTWVYELTPWGRELEGVLLALARWGSRATPVPKGELGADALMLALKTTFDGRDDLRAHVDLALGDDRFQLEVSAGGFTVMRGRAAAADAMIETDAPTLRRLVFGDQSLTAALRGRAVRIEGNQRLAARVLRSFRRPTVTGVTSRR